MDQTRNDYQAWFAEYKKRGEELETAIGATIFEALENSKPLLALPNIRKARASFPIRFCLLLYSTGFDEKRLREFHENSGSPLEDEEIRESQRVASENIAEAAAVLMPILSEADSESFIEDPVLPGWFVDGLRERFEPGEPPAQ